VLRGDELDPAFLTETARENELIYGFFGISLFVEVGGFSSALRCCGWALLRVGHPVRRLSAPPCGESALPATRGRCLIMKIDLRADLNREDDDGLGWTVLSSADRHEIVLPGAVLRAGTEKFWSWVRVTTIDDDGQIHFRRISAAEAKASGQLAETG